MADNITLVPWNSDFDCSWVTKLYKAGNFGNVICNGTNPINTFTLSVDNNGTSNDTTNGTTSATTTSDATSKNAVTISVAVIVPILALALLSSLAWFVLRRIRRQKQQSPLPSSSESDGGYKKSELHADSSQNWTAEVDGAGRPGEVGGNSVSELKGEDRPPEIDGAERPPELGGQARSELRGEDWRLELGGNPRSELQGNFRPRVSVTPQKRGEVAELWASPVPTTSKQDGRARRGYEQAARDRRSGPRRKHVSRDIPPDGFI